MTKKLLITGFDPFGGETINPAWEAVKLLPDKIGDFCLTKLEIPTVFGKGASLVADTAKQLHPDVILCIGQAGGRSSVTPERIAVNIRDAKITDNEDNQPQGLRVVPDGPAAYFATIDVDALVTAAQAQGYPAIASNSAGAFVCNDVFYTLSHLYDGTSTKVGFIHVPFLPQQGTPSMDLAQIVSTLHCMIEALHP